MLRLPPGSTRPEPLFPYTTPFRSEIVRVQTTAVVERPACNLLRDQRPERLERVGPIHLEGDVFRPVAHRGLDGLERRAHLDAHGAPTAGGSSCSVQLPSVPGSMRSEEHTSELQSLMRISYAVFCLKKKKMINHKNTNKEKDI